jgi:3-methyl-2-oxobutanoate hydroxymethyltransferase
LPASSASDCESPSSSSLSKRNPVTIDTIREKYEKSEKLTMITAYDYMSARIVDDAGADMILVGDSVGMVMLGLTDTVSVTMDDMIHHCKAVSRAKTSSFVIGDLPFGSYLNSDQALENATRLLKDGHVNAVKLEGGTRVVGQVCALRDAGIAVCGHLGLTPQTADSIGGFKVQGKSSNAAAQVLADALALQEAGCFAIVLECVPRLVAEYVTSKLTIPTIGIGAGQGTSGQVQVFHDVTGLFDRFTPKFAKQYTQGAASLRQAVSDYIADVQQGSFPNNKEHAFVMKRADFDAFVAGSSSTESSTEESNGDDIQCHVDVDKLPNMEALQRMHRLHNPGTAAFENSSHRLMCASSDRAGLVKHATKKRFGKRLFSSSVTATRPSLASEPDPTALQPHIVCIGGGAIGSTLAASFARCGFSRVSLLTHWREHIEAINSNGLALCTPSSTESSPISPFSESERIPLNTIATTCVHASDSPDDILAQYGLANAVFVAVKGKQETHRAAHAAQQLIGMQQAHKSSMIDRCDAFAVTVQNGIGNVEILSQYVAHTHAMVGVTQIAATVGVGCAIMNATAPTSIVANGNMYAADMLQHMFANAGLPLTIAAACDGDKVLWGKLLINMAVNPLAALLGQTNGALYENRAAHSMMEAVIGEVCSVAHVRGIPVPESPLEHVLAVLNITKANTSSMLADIVRNRMPEFELIDGFIEAARQSNVRVPVCKTLAALLRIRHSSAATMYQRFSGDEETDVDQQVVEKVAELERESSNQKHSI